MGLRMIEEFLVKTGAKRCSNFKETTEIICSTAFKMFLNIVPTVEGWSSDLKSCIIVIPEPNPLTDFVELPSLSDSNIRNDLWYSQVICGVLKGSLHTVQIDIDAFFLNDVLRGDQKTRLKLVFKKFLKNEVPSGDD